MSRPSQEISSKHRPREAGRARVQAPASSVHSLAAADRRRDKLFQAPGQPAGAALTLEALFQAAPPSPTCGKNRLRWYLAHPEKLPKAWRNKCLFFPETGRRRGSDTLVDYLFFCERRWQKATLWVGYRAGADDFVVVPQAAG